MKKLVLGILTACLFAAALATAATEEPELENDYPESYTVRKGDTLWDISDRFLKNPWMWPEIWHVNTQIANPHLIYPGDIIRLIYLGDKPRLTLERSERVAKLSPKTRVIETEAAIPTIPLSEVNSFLSRSRILGVGTLEEAPYVVAAEDQRLIVGAGDKLYGRGDFIEGPSVYGVYRRGDVFRDPITDEVLGIQARDIGTVELRAIDGDIATMIVTRTTEEIRVGDRFLVEEERPVDSFFSPSRPAGEVDGVIMAVEGGVTQVGKMDVVVINRGQREDMKVGNVLAVYKRGGQYRDRIKGDTITLPDERAGLLMIFRTFDKVSLGLILEAERPLAVMDRVRNP